MEKMTKIPALELLKQTQLFPSPPSNTLLLDNAAGAGCVTATLLQALEKEGKKAETLSGEGLKIVCGDLEPTMNASASARVKAKGWESVVEVQKVDALV